MEIYLIFAILSNVVQNSSGFSRQHVKVEKQQIKTHVLYSISNGFWQRKAVKRPNFMEYGKLDVLPIRASVLEVAQAHY